MTKAIRCIIVIDYFCFMINKKIAIDFAILATLNDLFIYFIGFFLTGNAMWLYEVVDFSTTESRSSLLMVIILKNSYVVGLLFLKYLYRSLNIHSNT